LAAGGMKFTDFHSNGAVCSPTRAALVTGRYQQRCGVEGVVTARGHRDKGIPLSETTFAEALKEAGYATALFGKWHLGYAPKYNPVHQGFDAFRGFVSGNVDYQSHIDQVGYADWWEGDRLKPEKGYLTTLIADHGRRFIEANKDRPFCLYLAHGAPHYPYQGPGDKANRTVGNPKPIGGSRKDKAGAYKEMIESLDNTIGSIVDTLEQHGLEKNTLVFFFSDNGPAGPGSAGPLRGKKGNIWEGGHRVPAIAYWPSRIKPGTVSHDTALGMDLFPTMTALAGVQSGMPAELDGIDLSNHLVNGEPLPERDVFWRIKRGKAIRRGPWKLVVTDDKKPPVLFNLAEDPGETQDVSGQHPDKTGDLLKALKAWNKSVSDGVVQQS
jgi:arylsulfatase A-like enzyme